MKRIWLSTAVTIYLLLLGTFYMALPQQKAPETVRLNSEASQVYLKLEEQKQSLERQQAAIRLGAGVPATHNQWTVDQGIVIFSQPTPLPKGTP